MLIYPRSLLIWTHLEFQAVGNKNPRLKLEIKKESWDYNTTNTKQTSHNAGVEDIGGNHAAQDTGPGFRIRTLHLKKKHQRALVHLQAFRREAYLAFSLLLYGKPVILDLF